MRRYSKTEFRIGIYGPIFLLLLALSASLAAILIDPPMAEAAPGAEGALALLWLKHGRVLLRLLLFNAAFVLFGWRHYRVMRAQIEERARAATRARTLAMRDPLTGFHNRRNPGQNYWRIAPIAAA